MIELQNICLKYDDAEEDQVVLKDVSFCINDGECVAVVGSSGCGKTTLLKVIAGLKQPQSGKRILNNEEVDGRLDDLAFVFQDYGLFPWKTIKENILLPYRIRKEKPDMKQFNQILDLLELRGYEKNYPSKLSGGQRQRVAIGRVLMGKENIILLDEPFSALDVRMRKQFIEVFRKRIRKCSACLIVTHSMKEALILGNRIIFLSENKKGILHIFENKEINTEDYQNTKEFKENLKMLNHLIMGEKYEALFK